MTEADARYAVELLDALKNLPDVRKYIALEKERMKLKIVAFEGDYQDGEGHGWALLPLRIASQIVAFTEDLIRRELRALRVTPAGEAEPTPKDEGRARGAHARAAALSPERRREIAKTASDARWGKAPNDAPPTGAKQ